MATKPKVNPEASIGQLVAHYLRFLREGADLSQEDLGRIIGVDRFVVAKIEATTRHLSRQHAVKLDKHFRTGVLFTSLVVQDLRERKHQTTSLNYRELEAEASTIKIYEALVVPALFQTPEYAGTLIAATGATPEEVQERVRARVSAQEVLTRPKPPLVIVLLSEAVLDWPVGGPEVMAGQLGHLLDVGQTPNVGIRVIRREAGAFLGLDGTFTVLSGPTGHIGYTEAPGEDEERFTFSLESAPYLDRFDRIGLSALSDYDSAKVIGEKREEYIDDKFRSRLAKIDEE